MKNSSIEKHDIKPFQKLNINLTSTNLSYYANRNAIFRTNAPTFIYEVHTMTILQRQFIANTKGIPIGILLPLYETKINFGFQHQSSGVQNLFWRTRCATFFVKSLITLCHYFINSAHCQFQSHQLNGLKKLHTAYK